MDQESRWYSMFKRLDQNKNHPNRLLDTQYLNGVWTRQAMHSTSPSPCFTPLVNRVIGDSEIGVLLRIQSNWAKLSELAPKFEAPRLRQCSQQIPYTEHVLYLQNNYRTIQSNYRTICMYYRWFCVWVKRTKMDINQNSVGFFSQLWSLNTPIEKQSDQE